VTGQTGTSRKEQLRADMLAQTRRQKALTDIAQRVLTWVPNKIGEAIQQASF
jgi:hypothetical protein